MIKSLEIQNFQSHEDNYLEFDKGVNIIVGSSDSGKTAIIRALRWLAFHKPSGDEMRSHWGGETRVELFTDDAHVVKKKDKEQEYILGDLHFKAFGTTVPDEIVQALNLSDVNLQMQLDAPFLLSETPGAVAQYFNKVARLDKIDRATQTINSSIRQLTNDIKYQEGQEGNYKEQLKQFEHLEKFEIEVEVLEEMDKKFINSVDTRRKLQVLVAKITMLQTDIEKASNVLKFEKPLDNIFKLKDEKEDLEIDGGSLWNDIEDIIKVREDIEKANKIVTVEKPLKAVLELYEELDSLETTQISLSKLLSTINNTTTMLNSKTALKSTLQAKLDEAMPVGSTCILCGQIIKR